MPLTCGDLIKRGRALYGEQPALLFEGRQFTFAEQAARMFRLANALLAMGVKRQERVAILARNCSEYIEIFGACEMAGFVAINLNSRLSAPELGAICQDSQPSVLIYSEGICGAGGSAGSAGRQHPHPDRHRSRQRGRPRATSKCSAKGVPRSPLQPPAAGDIAYLMYTSGTTGGAKGVMISHAAMVEATRMLSHESGIFLDRQGADRDAAVSSGRQDRADELQSDGRVGGAQGGFRPGRHSRRPSRRRRVTAAHFAPLMIQQMLDVLETKPYDVSTLRCVHYASAPMPVPLLRRALDRMGPIFVQVYGMTECLVGTILKAHDTS